MRIRAWFVLVVVVLLTNCDGGVEATGPAGRSELFPNEHWVSPTGNLQMAVGRNIRNFLGTNVSWEDLLAGYDGFSPLQPVLIPTRQGCPDLPTAGREAASVADDSPVLLFETPSGRRIPWFGEAGEDPTICEIYPLDRFSDGSEIWVLGTTTFAADLAPGTVGQVDTVAAARATGFDPSHLAFAGRFRVGSLENRLRAAFAVRDAALAWAAERTDLLAELDRNPPEAAWVDDHALVWKGEFRVPDFTGSDGRIHYDSAGRALVQGETREQFFVVADTSVTRAVDPLPVVVYGHGLFGDPREVLYGSQHALRTHVSGIFGAIPWGMAIRYFHRAAFALMDPTRLPLLRDQVLQGLANQVLFARVLRDEIAPLAAASVGKTAAHDVDYIGISQGGILGSPLVALSPDIRRATLHVGGGGWTPMMTHSSNWRNDDGFGYGNAIEGTVPDATARTLLMALWQSVWDEWDPALFAPYWLTKPSWSSGPAPRADRSVYYPYAIADPQVPNFASETVMRSAGIALLSPSITEPFGIALVTYPRVGPGAVAAQWDVGPGEAAHGEPRKLRAFAAQVAEFIRSGGLLDPCGGQACKFDLDTAIRD